MMEVNRPDRPVGPDSVRLADMHDATALHSVCRQSYIESFADHWNEGGLDWYLDKVYGMDILERDLQDTSINYFISYCDNVPAGFMKLKMNSALSDKMTGKHIEIEKLYFLEKYKRRGLGKQMISTAMNVAKSQDARIVWLAVIDTNTSAINFYERHGFKMYDKTRLEIPYFKDELRGMWRMILEIAEDHNPANG